MDAVKSTKKFLFPEDTISTVDWSECYSNMRMFYIRVIVLETKLRLADEQLT